MIIFVGMIVALGMIWVAYALQPNTETCGSCEGTGCESCRGTGQVKRPCNPFE